MLPKMMLLRARYTRHRRLYGVQGILRLLADIAIRLPAQYGPKNFLGIWPANAADLFVPITCGASIAPELGGDPLNSRDLKIFRIVLRLARGVTMPMAEAAVKDLATLVLDHEEHE
jgi:hypothetical protein